MEFESFKTFFSFQTIWCYYAVAMGKHKLAAKNLNQILDVKQVRLSHGV